MNFFEPLFRVLSHYKMKAFFRENQNDKKRKYKIGNFSRARNFTDGFCRIVTANTKGLT